MRTPTIERAHPTTPGGTQRLYYFGNGYGASVVRSQYTYGGPAGLWELAVLEVYDTDKNSWSLTYDTPITDDVLGYLSGDAVDEFLEQIEALPPREAS